MALSDNNPERRNLNLTSLSIIIFYLAEGNFIDSSIKLQVVNISFSKPYVLCGILWAMLFWFALRYWQTHKGEFSRSYLEDIKTQKRSKPVINYVKSRTGKEFQETGGFVPNEIERRQDSLVIRIGDVQGGYKNSDGVFTNYRSNNYETVEITGFTGAILHIHLFLKLSLFKPNVGNYLMPYLLFFVAVFLGFVNNIL